MSGYNVVFPAMFDGSLGGKWPAGPVWCTLLTLKDRHGIIDMSYQAIASRTGWPVDLLRQGIEQLTQPDPDSRSSDEDGRRLVPLDPERSWGWRVVNHALYHEKARVAAKDAAQIEDGRNAEKCKRYRDRVRGTTTPRDTPRHPETPRNTPSDSDSDSDSKNQIRAQEGASSPRSRPEYEDPAFHAKVVASYHQRLSTLPRVRKWTATRQRLLNACIRDLIEEGRTDAASPEYWDRVFDVVASRPFMLGDNDRGWKADLEWILKPANFLKIREGRYADRKQRGSGPAAGAAHAS